MYWPDGYGAQLRVDGRSRDLLTPLEGDPTILAEDALSVGVGAERTIEDIDSERRRPGVDRLVGAQGAGRLRAVIDDAVPDERDAGTPLYLLLDDLAGATLIAGFAWSQSVDDWQEYAAQRISENPEAARIARRPMEGICSGFRPGSSALARDGTVKVGKRHNVASVPPLVVLEDPIGWHALKPHPSVAMRRARRIDIWREGGDLVVDAMFRDSCWRPDGTEVAVHEYSIDARIEADSGLLTSVQANPHVLPYPECSPAATKAERMNGASVRELRAEVLNRLRGIDCCTHLNDALRSLAEVPVLATHLPPGDAPTPV
jgi:Protein of unknown function (DUF2889)